MAAWQNYPWAQILPLFPRARKKLSIETYIEQLGKLRHRRLLGVDLETDGQGLGLYSAALSFPLCQS